MVRALVRRLMLPFFFIAAIDLALAEWLIHNADPRDAFRCVMSIWWKGEA